MSQHSLSIPNESGAEVRADMNNALQALASNASGTSAPPVTYAYQWWADTQSGQLKQRNGANSAWIVRGSLAEIQVVARSSNTVLGVGDYGTTITATGTFTQTLASASVLGNGWWCNYKNAGTGVVTLDPNGAEAIEGAPTLGLYPGEGCTIVCDGAGFKTFGRSTGLVFLGAAVASSASYLSLSLPGEFSEFEFAARSLLPSTNNVGLMFQYSVDAGSSWLTSGLYTWMASQNLNTAPDDTGLAGTSVGHIELANAVSSSSFGGGIELSGTIHTGGGSNVVRDAVFAKSAWLVNSDEAWAKRVTYGAIYNAGATPNAFRVLMTSGSILSGTVRLWGKRK